MVEEFLETRETSQGPSSEEHKRMTTSCCVVLVVSLHKLHVPWAVLTSFAFVPFVALVTSVPLLHHHGRRRVAREHQPFVLPHQLPRTSCWLVRQQPSCLLRSLYIGVRRPKHLYLVRPRKN
jgi:hypothetical protein